MIERRTPAKKQQEENVTASTDTKKQKLKRKFSPFHLLFMALRISAGVLYMLITIGFLTVIVPFRLFNPILTKMGVKRLPHDLFVKNIWATSMLKVFGIEITAEGQENFPTECQAGLVMYSHASSIDPFVVASTGPIGLKAIFKKSLLYTAPFMFPLAYLYGHVPIDRSNRESAIKSLEKASKRMKKYNYPILIAPEGTRSPTGELQAFKKGPFHLAKGANVTIYPAVLFGNHDIWPPKQLLPYSGHAVIRYLPPIVTTEKDTVDSLCEKVHSAMEEAFKHPPKINPPSENIGCALLFYAVSIATIYLYYHH